MKTTDIKRLSKLGALIRSGRATTAQETEFDRLDAAYRADQHARQAAQPQPRTVWDLPIAKALYEADRRSQGGF